METNHLTATVTYSRKVGKPNYSSEDAGIFVQIDFPLGTSPTDMETQLQAAFAQAKASVFEELGIGYTIGTDGSVEEAGVIAESKSGSAPASIPASNVTPITAAPTAAAATAAAPVQQHKVYEGQKKASTWLKDGDYASVYLLLQEDQAAAAAQGIDYNEWWGGKDSAFYCNQAMRTLQRKGLTSYPTDYHNDQLAGNPFKGKLDDFRVKPNGNHALAGMRGLFFLMEKHTDFSTANTPTARDAKYLSNA